MDVLSVQSFDVSAGNGGSVAVEPLPISRAYEAAKVDRRNSRWNPPNRSADLELLSSAATIRARCRDLARNNSYAQAILRARLRNIVGCGIRPQARVVDGADEPIESINTNLENVFWRWQDRADVTGRLSFMQMQRLIFREVDEAGEVLVQFVRSRDRSRVMPLALEMIEADRLAEDAIFPRGFNTDNGNEVRRGVEINSSGRPVAYWVYPNPPQDVNTLHVRPERRRAENILHLFRQERVGQTRGVSMLAPAVRRIRDTEFYLENELTASAVAACFAVAIKTMDGGAGGGFADSTDSSSSDSDGNGFEYMQPGLVARLFPGEEVETINPTRTNSALDPFMEQLQRAMAMGTGLSYERLSRDYSQTNFSSNRASDLEDRREFRPEQEWLVRDLCEPVWRRFVESAVVDDLVDGMGAMDVLTDFNRMTDHIWQPPGWEWVDPQKEATASVVSLENNLTTHSAELAKRGLDLNEVLKQRKREKDLMESMGLESDSDVPGVAANIDGSEDETSDETEVANVQ